MCHGRKSTGVTLTLTVTLFCSFVPVSPDSQPNTHITRALKLKQMNRIQPSFSYLPVFTCRRTAHLICLIPSKLVIL